MQKHFVPDDIKKLEKRLAVLRELEEILKEASQLMEQFKLGMKNVK